MKRHISFIVVLLFCNTTFSQKVEFEKTFDISKKAAKGVLSDIAKDDNNNRALIYITGVKHRFFKDEVNIKKEAYVFDKDYNFIQADKDVDKYKLVKEKKPKAKGENYSEEVIEPDVNFSGVFMVRKVRYDYKWRKSWRDYEVSYTNIEKIKPRDSKDRKLLYITHTNSANGDMVALTTPKAEPGSTYCKEFLLLTVKNGTDINISSETTISFEKQHAVIGFCYVPNANGLADGNNEPLNDVIAILQPFKSKQVQQNKYVYLRFDAQGKILANNTFEAPPCWDIYFFPNGSNELLLIGRSSKALEYKFLFGHTPISFEAPYDRKIVFANKFGGVMGGKQIPVYLVNQAYAKDKRYVIGQTNTPVIRAQKATDIYVAYFKDNQFVSSQTYDIKTMNTQFKVSSKEKKPKAIPFNPYDYLDFYQYVGEDLFVGCNVGTKKGYKSYNLINFSKDGKLKNLYQIKPDEDNKSYAAIGAKPMAIMPSQKGGVTLILAECEGSDLYREGNDIYNRLLYRTRVTRINPDGSMNPFTTVGKNEKGKIKYFLDEEYPVIEETPDYMVLFGRDKGDDTLWFCKIVY